MPTARDLADRYHRGWTATFPLTASQYGIPGHDADVPDDSEAGDARRRAEVEAVLADARALEAAGLTGDDAVTVGCVVSAANQELAALESAAVEYTVTAMPVTGPATLFAVAARTLLLDAGAADDYVTRLRRSGAWIDQLTKRLQAGEAKGRRPVAPLVAQAIAWGDALLADPVPAPIAAPAPPAGWSGEADWRAARDTAATDVVRPALVRWLDQLRVMLPTARPADQAGLAHLPGGEADYARAVSMHTTLSTTAGELHDIGRAEVARLESRCLEHGAELGLDSLAEIYGAMRAAAAAAAPADAIDAAVTAVRRAEGRAGEIFPQPLPPPCEVTPMPRVVAASGMAPHYSPPRLDGARAGTYWFNTERPTAGTGWDIEGVAFHETVPGHHLQLSRIQLLDHLPDFQRQRSITVFSEGWGLYAEQLAEEIGLYSGPHALIGAMAAGLMRGARLVVDTGLHAYGWSRQEAVDYFVAHVPMPEAFLANEVDRYIAWPGQALAYLTGKLEILRQRDRAQVALGQRFSLPEFHAAVLDHGSLPLPVLQRSIGDWLATA